MTQYQSLRPATEKDWLSVSSRLREADHREVLAVTGFPAPLMLPECCKISDRVFSILTRDGHVAGLVGTQPVMGFPEVGWVWMVGTPLIETHHRDFLRYGRSHLPTIFGPYQFLTNYADIRNPLHLKWLRFMGFKFTRIIPWGVQQRPFVEFIGINQDSL